MARGAFYPIYSTLNLYVDTFSAADYGNVGLYPVSKVYPNTGSDSDVYNAIYNGEKGNCYVNTAFGWGYSPTVNLWWVRETYAGAGWEIGWTNDSKNIGASTPTLNKSSMLAGETVRITTNRLNSSYKHNIKWRIGNGNWTTIATGVEAYWDWTPSIDLVATALPSSISGTFAILVETLNGSKLLGSKQVNIALSLPTSVSPSIGDLSVEESSPFMMNTMKLGYFVAGVSRIKPSVSSKAAGQGATIKSELWEMGGLALVVDSFPATSNTNMTLKYTLTDSRGRVSYKTLNVTQTPYSKPSIQRFTATRYNESNPNQVVFDLQADGTRLVRAGATDGYNQNPLRFKIDKKAPTDTTWTTHKAMTDYNYRYGIDLTSSTMADIENSKKYQLRVTVEDRFGTASSFEFVLNATSKLWVEITDGEDFNFIGNLQNNGSQVLTQACFYQLDLNFTNGACVIPASTLRTLRLEKAPNQYFWIPSIEYKSGVGIAYAVAQPTSTNLTLYARANSGTTIVAIPDGTYKVALLRSH